MKNDSLQLMIWFFPETFLSNYRLLISSFFNNNIFAFRKRSLIPMKTKIFAFIKVIDFKFKFLIS